MTNWFSNISVNLKLGLGFGIVLLLTLSIAIAGWTSLGGLIDRSQRMADITQLVGELTKLRIARLQFMLANGDAAAGQLAQNSMDSFTQQVQKGLGTFKSADNLQRLTQLSQLASEYQQSFNKMRGGYTAMNSQGQVVAGTAPNAEIVQARKEMTDEGASIVKLCDDLYENQRARSDADGSQARNLQAGATALALLIGIFAAWAITRQITRPLNDTLKVVERIAAGDLAETAAVTRRDEIGVLQQGVRRMGSTLRELIGGIRDGVAQIASAAEELSAITEQTRSGVNSQKIETDQVATAMQEMTATSHEVARNAEQASLAAASADSEARVGDKLVSEAIQQIERLATEVSRSTEAMSRLQGESDKIGSVMDVIKAVAEQTNLLALNAAIEAARAGDAGRGFAVVADEVRALAKRTQKSTEEIEALVAALHSGTRHVSAVMENSHGLTQSSVELTRQAGASLASITHTVAGIQAMNQQIATAVEEQSAVAEDISRSIVNVRDVSEQTATSSEQTARASAELAHLGGQLQTLVSRFRV